MPDLLSAAHTAADQLRATGQCVVFAESCTAGLVAASLSRIAGISEFLCGSFVTYRNASKAGWIDVLEDLLDDPGPVSEVVATAMARGALGRTPEADLALSVTGHLGPQAPDELDGVVCIGLAHRIKDSIESGSPKRIQLPDRIPADEPADSLRDFRQQLAVEHILRTLADSLSTATD